jgi:hypothetical protein
MTRTEFWAWLDEYHSKYSGIVVYEMCGWYKASYRCIQRGVYVTVELGSHRKARDARRTASKYRRWLRQWEDTQCTQQ